MKLVKNRCTTTNKVATSLKPRRHERQSGDYDSCGAETINWFEICLISRGSSLLALGYRNKSQFNSESRPHLLSSQSSSTRCDKIFSLLTRELANQFFLDAVSRATRSFMQLVFHRWFINWRNRSNNSSRDAIWHYYYAWKSFYMRGG